MLRLALHDGQRPETLAAVLREVVHAGIGLERAGRDPEHRDAPGERVGDGLPDERGGRGPVSRIVGLRLAALRIGRRKRMVRRRRKIGENRVEQWPDAHVGLRRGAHEREHLPVPRCGAQPSLQLFLAQRAFLEEAFHEGFVGFGDHLDQRFPGRVRRAGQLWGNVAGRGPATGVVGERDALHGDQIHGAPKAPLRADRELDRHHLPAERPVHRFEGAVEARALAVEQIEDQQTGQPELLRDVPHLLGLHFNAGDRVDDDECRVRHPQGGPRIAQEVAHSGRVDQVDLRRAPLGESETGRQRVLAVDLFLVEVGDRRTVVDPPQAVDHLRAEQHRGHELRLAGTAVPDDRDIADVRRVIDLHRQ